MRNFHTKITNRIDEFVLLGHSGCDLRIVKLNKQLIVVKTSKSIEYNDRLSRQALKQECFVPKVFNVPKIFYKGYNNEGLFYFSMQFLNGITLSEYFKIIPIFKIYDVANILLSIIPINQVCEKSTNLIFYNKIQELKNSIRHQSKLLSECYSVLERFDWKYATNSQCHGDLTLENVIYCNNQFYFIDFLDSFYDSWLIDFAKIFQDIELFWSYRHMRLNDNNLYIRLLILKKLLLDKLNSMHNGKQIVKTIYYLLLLNIIRIIPYTTEDTDLMFLFEKIDYLFQFINSL